MCADGVAGCTDVNNRFRTIAYFSMEIGINPKIPTYSGGLGVLAGDTVKSFADLKIAAVAVTLLYRKGYFRQELSDAGEQRERPVEWDPRAYLTLLPNKTTVTLSGRTVALRTWRYLVEGLSGQCVPVLFLDTGIEGNSAYDRSLTDHLYGGDEEYRLSQEALLGIGGIRMLRELGFVNLNRYHMNEGHAALLALELLNERRRAGEILWDIEGVRPHCVFTTHTPVSAGHDKFPYPLVGKVLGDYFPVDILRIIGGRDELNMTLLGLNLSHYVNGVAKEHGRVSRGMFPRYAIDYITNGVHSPTWVNEHFKSLFSRYIPGWTQDPFSLRSAFNIPRPQIWEAHQKAKADFIGEINRHTNARMDPDTLTIGFARRATAYKRANLIFRDIAWLKAIVQRAGKIQLVFAGKAHHKDLPGKEMIKEISSIAKAVKDQIPIVYLEDYGMELAGRLTSGVDLWLNTPQKPLEASGTSGMKAAHNGVPSFSILDGWWVEGCVEGLTGWSIGSPPEQASNDDEDARSLYEKLEHVVIPAFYERREEWLAIMRHAIAINASFFNTHRMVQQYILNAYFAGSDLLIEAEADFEKYTVAKV